MTDDFLFTSKPTLRGSAQIHIRDSIEFLKEKIDEGTTYHAVIVDPPYEISLYNKKWDGTGIAFSTEFWSLVYQVMKPGAFLAAFAATRMYHRLATSIEDSGFRLYPFLNWEFPTGLQKPVNVSELFDRDNIVDRKVIGLKQGSGYTTAKVKHGMQNLTRNKFPVYERDVSDEAKEWSGFYYGLNCFRPSMEPIALAQKPISHKRVIDNIREFRTGALNLKSVGADGWPTTSLKHKKAKFSDHQSEHPSVKPVSLMTDLCKMLCPSGGHILDTFGGTGTTAQAAIENGFDCTLVEADPSMEAVIERRLATS